MGGASCPGAAAFGWARLDCARGWSFSLCWAEALIRTPGMVVERDAQRRRQIEAQAAGRSLGSDMPLESSSILETRSPNEQDRVFAG
jgi:hypothetical protein